MGQRLICIVDDDGGVRSSLASLMRSLLYDVETFESAETFLASEAADNASLVITDVDMPRLGGFGLKRALDLRNCSVPVVMISARSEPGLRSRAMAGGAIGFLPKPLDIATLITQLETALAET